MPSKLIRSMLAGAALALSAVPMTVSAQQPEYGENYAQDRAQIEDLMARYLFAIDYQDWDAYVATFAEDGILEFASGTTQGREAIRETVVRFASGMARAYHTEDGKLAKLRHVILQSSVRVEGDRAWARSLWLEMANHGPGDTMKMGTYGIYEDEMVKQNGQWLFAKRNVLNEFIPNRNSGPGNPVAEMDRLAEAALKGG